MQYRKAIKGNAYGREEEIYQCEDCSGCPYAEKCKKAEGTFGIIKNDRWYKRIVRRGIKSVQLEIYLVSLGHNLYKFHNKQMKTKSAA